jgi:hypothetical protein
MKKILKGCEIKRKNGQQERRKNRKKGKNEKDSDSLVCIVLIKAY